MTPPRPRKPSQRPPDKGSDARTVLEKLFTTAQSNTVAVVALRADGGRVLFGHFDRIAAESTVQALARVGLRAEVVANIDPELRPGTAIRSP